MAKISASEIKDSNPKVSPLMQQYNTMMRSNPNAVQYADQSMGYPGGFTPTFANGGAITIEDLFYIMNKANKR